MISHVLEILEEVEGISSNDADVNVILTGAVVLVVYAEGGDHYYAKITDKFDMENEYEGTRQGFLALPGHVAEPIAMRHIEGKQVIICKGITHVPIAAAELLKPTKFLIDELLAFFECSVTRFCSDEHVSPSAVFFSHRGDFRHSEKLSPRLLSVFSEAGGLIESHGAVLQHGDFTVNNIGKTSSGLVYFDWEDYGRISALGFDVCMLVVSTLGFEEARIRAFFSERRHSALAEIVDWVSNRLGIAVGEYLGCFPYYLLLNAALKSSYGDRITMKNIELAELLAS